MSKNMQTYYFYMVDDPNKEAISIVTANSREEAIKIFCIQKKLEEKDFLELFEVELN